MRYDSNRLVDQLQVLGLTASQAKAYLAVVKLGPCRVVQIAREAGLQRTEIYRLMSRLISLGLIEETLDTPKRYRSCNIKDAISSLTDETMRRLDSVVEGSERLVAKLESMRTAVKPRYEPEVRVITGVGNVQRNFLELLSSAEKEVWMMAGLQHIARGPRSVVAHALKAITSKHLKARLVVEADERTAKRLMRHIPLIEIRRFERVGVHLYGIDSRSVCLGLTPPRHGSDQWSEVLVTHRETVQVMRNFFDALWKQATPLGVSASTSNGAER